MSNSEAVAWAQSSIDQLEARLKKLENAKERPYKGRLYIAGPMTGLPERNFHAFAEAARLLRADGFNVLSPHEIPNAHRMIYEDCMRACIKLLLRADFVYVLPGWEKSKGAVFEHRMANIIGVPCIEYSTGLPAPKPVDFGTEPSEGLL